MLVLLLGLYELSIAPWAHHSSNTSIKIGVEIFFFILVGPAQAFWILKLTSHWLEEEKHTDKPISTDEHHLASIVNTTIDTIFNVDLQGRIETWNRGAEMLFGYAASQIIEQPLSLLLGKGAAANVESRWLIETAHREGFVRRHQTTCYDVTGRAVSVELTATRLENDHGELSGMSVVLRDITLRKRREEETRRLNARLNQQAEEHARELAEKIEQLDRANMGLKQLDQTRSEFVSLVSHQIRAPLTNIAGATQRMQADCGAINPTCNRMFAIFEQQVARLDRLVTDVLNAARIEVGELSLQMEPISVLPVVRQIVQQVSARTPTRAVHVADKPGLPMVYADRDRLAEVLSNLLDNADKYSPPNRDVYIDIRADEKEVTTSVHDTGTGLPTEDLERMFDKFHRVDSSDSQAAYGYGLGLYICRRLIEIQNGRIWAENHPDGGAIFSFSLPIWRENHEPTNDFIDRR